MKSQPRFYSDGNRDVDRRKASRSRAKSTAHIRDVFEFTQHRLNLGDGFTKKGH